MKESEFKALRIGNLVIGENGDIMPVEYIIKNKEDDYTIGLTNNIGGVCKHEKNPIVSYRTDKIKGVPLSEQWLLDFGFYELKPLESDEHKWSTFGKEGVYIDLPYFEFNLEEISIEIKFVHQLQNLYYSLTNKELK